MHKLIEELYNDAIQRLELCESVKSCDDLKRDWKRAMKEIDAALWRCKNTT